MLRGGNALYEFVQKKLEIGHKETTADGVFSLEEVECIGACTGAPAMQVNYDFYENLTAERATQIFEALEAGRKPETSTPITGAVKPRHPDEVPVISRLFGVQDSHKLDVYLANDGYKGMERALKELTPEQVIDEVKKSNLRGRGGAGFPTGMKWSFVPKESAKPKYILCNADESEPGTCKDRPLMELMPHQLIEGMVIAGRAVGSHQGYIYIRGEYRYVLDIMDRAIEEAYKAGYLGKNILGSGFDFDLMTHTGAGAYECGEESALMESLEGKRGYPRIRPPFPAVVGLYGSPTVINNVETLVLRPGNSAARRRMVRRPGLGEKWRHAPVLHFRPREQAGHLRIADGIFAEANDRRRCRRHARRQETQGRDSRRQFLPAADRRRNRRPHGLRFGGQGRLDAGLRRPGGH